MKERYFKANAEADEKDTSEQPHTGTGNRVQQFKSWLYFPSISALRANRDMKQVWWWKLTQEKCRSFVNNHQSNTVMLFCQFVCLSVYQLSSIYSFQHIQIKLCVVPDTNNSWSWLHVWWKSSQGHTKCENNFIYPYLLWIVIKLEQLHWLSIWSWHSLLVSKFKIDLGKNIVSDMKEQGGSCTTHFSFSLQPPMMSQ